MNYLFLMDPLNTVIAMLAKSFQVEKIIVKLDKRQSQRQQGGDKRSDVGDKIEQKGQQPPHQHKIHPKYLHH